MTRTDRFFFVHLQKTAGTSLWAGFTRAFAPEALYPDDSDRAEDPVAAVISVDHLQRRWALRQHEIEMVTGHFPLCVAELLGGGFTTLTLLRHPYDRTVSYLRHHRKVTAADRHLSLEEVYDDPDRFHGLVHNHMVKMLSLTTEEMNDGALTPVSFTPERVERAKRNLTTIDVVGLQERFDDFRAELTARFGWQMGADVYANRTTPVDVPDDLADRIMADNAADLELYRFAEELVDGRAQPAVPSS